jgi:hypothetical protein
VHSSGENAGLDSLAGSSRGSAGNACGFATVYQAYKITLQCQATGPGTEKGASEEPQGTIPPSPLEGKAILKFRPAYSRHNSDRRGSSGSTLSQGMISAPPLRGANSRPASFLTSSDSPRPCGPVRYRLEKGGRQNGRDYARHGEGRKSSCAAGGILVTVSGIGRNHTKRVFCAVFHILSIPQIPVVPPWACRAPHSNQCRRDPPRVFPLHLLANAKCPPTAAIRAARRPQPPTLPPPRHSAPSPP